MKISARAGSKVFEVFIDRENGRYVVEIDGERRIVDAQKLEGDFYSIVSEGRSYEVSVEPDGDGYQVRHQAAEQYVELSDPGRRARAARTASGGPVRIVAAMPGRIARLLVEAGQHVEGGQGLVVVEAMKMENEITSPRAGTVTSIAVEAGQSVEGGAPLIVIE